MFMTRKSKRSSPRAELIAHVHDTDKDKIKPRIYEFLKWSDQAPIYFDRMTAETFGWCIMSYKKPNGDYYRPVTYQGFRSALFNLNRQDNAINRDKWTAPTEAFIKTIASAIAEVQGGSKNVTLLCLPRGNNTPRFFWSIYDYNLELDGQIINTFNVTMNSWRIMRQSFC